MPRPHNESKNDISNQKHILVSLAIDARAAGAGDLFVEERNIRDPNAGIDADVRWRHPVNKKVKDIAIIEVKTRFNDKHTYPTLIISKNKIDAGLIEAEQRNLPLFIVIWWDDGCFGTELSQAPLVTRWGGREDRGQTGDKEEVYHIPIENFNLPLFIRWPKERSRNRSKRLA